MKRLDMLGIFLCGLLVGTPIGVHILDTAMETTKKTNLLTLQQAQRILEAQMREVCRPWFNDGRGRVTEHAIVACTAPEFLYAETKTL